MTFPASGWPAPSRMASAWNALGDRSAISRRRRSNSVRNASDARTRLGATSAADRLAPGNSFSKSGGTRTGCTSTMPPILARTLITRLLAI